MKTVTVIGILGGLLLGFLVVLYLTTASCPEGKKVTLEKPYQPELGFAYIVHLPQYDEISDWRNEPNQSPIVVCEKGRMLGPAHSRADDIRNYGRGRFSHWVGGAPNGARPLPRILFSTSDNSDPNTNGREYSVIEPGEGIFNWLRRHFRAPLSRRLQGLFEHLG
jgi:hypothetical protein